MKKSEARTQGKVSVAQRLIKFAKEGKLGRGEAPPKDSYWTKIVLETLECPAHGGGGVACVCKYHQLVISVSDLLSAILHLT